MENSTSVSALTVMCPAGIGTAAGFGQLTKKIEAEDYYFFFNGE